jgi:hypothetical protein
MELHSQHLLQPPGHFLEVLCSYEHFHRRGSDNTGNWDYFLPKDDPEEEINVVYGVRSAYIVSPTSFLCLVIIKPEP